jgi:hypothetical protein
VKPIAIDEVYLQLDGSMFINDELSNEEHETTSDNEDELSCNYDTDSDGDMC